MSQISALWHKAIKKFYTKYLWRVLCTEGRKQREISHDSELLYNWFPTHPTIQMQSHLASMYQSILTTKYIFKTSLNHCIHLHNLQSVQISEEHSLLKKIREIKVRGTHKLRDWVFTVIWKKCERLNVF